MKYVQFIVEIRHFCGLDCTCVFYDVKIFEKYLFRELLPRVFINICWNVS